MKEQINSYNLKNFSLLYHLIIKIIILNFVIFISKYVILEQMNFIRCNKMFMTFSNDDTISEMVLNNNVLFYRRYF